MKNAIWLKASVIMMKYTPRVRRQTMPVMNANNAAASIATGNAISASPRPWRCEDADRIGSEADGPGVAKRHEPAEADQQIERDRGHREDHHAGDECENVFFGAEHGCKRNDHEHCENDNRQ